MYDNKFCPRALLSENLIIYLLELVKGKNSMKSFLIKNRMKKEQSILKNFISYTNIQFSMQSPSIPDLKGNYSKKLQDSSTINL